MATGPATLVADVIVPEIFTPYVQNLTEEKTRIIASGAVVNDGFISNLLAGGGKTFEVPGWKDLDNDDANVMTSFADDVYSSPAYNTSNNSVPKKIETLQETAVRLLRHQSWSSGTLAGLLAGSDPMNAIAQRVASYWARQRQKTFIAMMNGVFADNAAAPSGSEHVQNDLTFNASGGAFQEGVTNFTASNFLKATLTMGDSQNDLSMIMVHSIVYSRMLDNNLLDFVADSANPNAERVATFLGKEVIMDDSMPNSGGVFESWIFGPGAVGFGAGAPPVPTEIERHARAGNGAGQDVLHNRVHWCIHPYGHAYVGVAPDGGPSNGTGSNQLANAGSWQRVYPERKQIKFARLLTREFQV